MHDLYLVFLAGLLGSAHCLGMCGPFVLAIGTARDRRAGFLHQGAYHLGKTLTYTVLGAVAGVFGSTLAGMAGVQSALSIAAGVLMLVIGLGLVGILDRFAPLARLGNLPVLRQAMGYFLRQRSLQGTLGLGLLNGLLPCGLVYGLLVKAASTGSFVAGALTMAVFGLATVPALLALGMTGHLAGPVWRNRFNLASGIVVILLGLMTVLRGTPAIKPVMAVITGGSHGAHPTMHEPSPAPHTTPAEHPMH